MRFDSARVAGLQEEQVELVEDDYAEKLPPETVAALRLTDLIIGATALEHVDAQEVWSDLHRHFSDEQISELMLGVGLFHGMSKVLITLGLEPEDMPVTVLPSPGSQS